jgi:hypothetical protein
MSDASLLPVLLLLLLPKPDGNYSGGFVSEFKIFVAELREFFNAAGLTDLLCAVKGAMSNEDQQVRTCWVWGLESVVM